MSLIHSFVTQRPLTITRELLVIALVVVLATLATLVFSGPGAGVPFDTRLDQLALPF
jgi:hypothetical protein